MSSIDSSNSSNGNNGYFVTGTDTGIGKTLVSCALLYALAQQGRRVAGMKPVASGTSWTNGAWRNDDVEWLRAAANVKLPDALINPYLLHVPTAPHIAAAAEGKTMSIEHIEHCVRAVRDSAVAAVDTVVVEGVGGFMVPLDSQLGMDDLAMRLGLPVILVVGIRLGCINHALLTLHAIAATGLPLAGWVANVVDPEILNLSTTIDSLQHRINAPLLGRIPYLSPADPVQAAQFLDISQLPSAL